MSVVKHSIEILKSNQAETGAFVASPTFEPYQYCWFRDGAYTAYALDLWGESESAGRFFEWSCNVILDREERILRSIQAARAVEPVRYDFVLHARYTLSGEEVTDVPWADFQLDGLGTWLWALSEHLQNRDDQRGEFARAASLAFDYLLAMWMVPCFDIWEENDQSLHTYTLATVWSGLRAWTEQSDNGADLIVDQVRQFVLRNGLVEGAFVRSLDDPAIDASLLGLGLPARMLPLDDARMVRTVERIEGQLCRENGVHRNMEDSYYGGGAWLLLSAWLAWYYLELDQSDRAQPLLAWVEANREENGWMPEQVPQNLNEPSALERWRGYWGPSASPLLWSHAKYLIAAKYAGLPLRQDDSRDT